MINNDETKMVTTQERRLDLPPISGVGVRRVVPAVAKQSQLGLYLTARDAFKMKMSEPQVMLVDIRPSAEVAAAGMPAVADANVPYITPATEELAAPRRREVFDREFLAAIKTLLASRGLARNTPLILICRAGGASACAADLLAAAGHRKVYTVVDGFEGDRAHSGDSKGERVVNGWKNSGLPWLFPDRARPRCNCH